MYNPKNETRKSEIRPFNSYTYAGRWVTDEVSKNEFPENSMDSRAAYQLIHDEMMMFANICDSFMLLEKVPFTAFSKMLYLGLNIREN